MCSFKYLQLQVAVIVFLGYFASMQVKIVIFRPFSLKCSVLSNHRKIPKISPPPPRISPPPNLKFDATKIVIFSFQYLKLRFSGNSEIFDAKIDVLSPFSLK